MRVYHYDDDRVFTRASDLNDGDRDPKNKSRYLLPAKCTEIPPPGGPLKEFHSWQWDGKAWASVVDYRGAIPYNKKTREEGRPIARIGEEVDFTTFTIKTPKMIPFEKFNEDLNDWVEDLEAKEKDEKEARVYKLKEQLKELDIKKLRHLFEVLKEDDSGKKYFDEYEAETVKLREELKDLEGSWQKKGDIQI